MINILQFCPYFPPHKGGLETACAERGFFYTKHKKGKFINIIFDIGQNIEEKTDIIFYKNEAIGYKQDGYKVLLLPSFEIITNFPFPKFWKKHFWLVFGFLKTQNFDIILTNTRFFSSSLLGGIYAKIKKIKWIHFEYGGDYVKLSNRFFSVLAFLYDKLFGNIIFWWCDEIFAISEGSKHFIQKHFTKREVKVFYRGLQLPSISTKKNSEIETVFIGRLVKLKGIDILFQAVSEMETDIGVIIIGDGEEKGELQKLSKKLKIDEKVKFLGFKDADFIHTYLSQNKVILVNPSYQEGMPTTVMEALFYENAVVATDVGGTPEISPEKDLLLCKKGDYQDLKKQIEKALSKYDTLVGKSKSYIKKTFDWDTIILDFYNHL